MVINSAEYLAAQADNSAFADTFRTSIKRHLLPLPLVRTLDYGAGQTLHSRGPFGDLFRVEQVVAYDPSADMEIYRKLSDDIKRQVPLWVDRLPDISWQFHLIGFHFSLHHMEEPLEEIIGGITIYRPSRVAIVDYDYQTATQDQFSQTFISGTEQNELQDLFGGDVPKGFDFHRRYGIGDYEAAFRTNGFKVKERGFGTGAARYKFYLIG